MIPTHVQLWQKKVLCGTLLGYMCYNMLRVNLPLVMPKIQETLKLTHMDVGWIFSGFSLAYAFGRLMNGLLSDQKNARRFFMVGLGLCSVINLCFLGIQSYFGFLILWGLNGWFQTMGGPASARILTHWFPREKMGSVWAIWSASHPLGAAMTALLTSQLIHLLGWKLAFISPVCISCVVMVFLFFVLKDRPEEVLSADDVSEITKTPQPLRPHWTTKEILHQVFSNPRFWLICVASFCLYFIRTGFMNWSPIVIKEIHGIDIKKIAEINLVYDVGGLIGGLLAGWVSDRFFQSKRGFVGCLYMVGLAAVLSYFVVLIVYDLCLSPWLDLFMIVLFGFLSFGPQVLVGVASTDFATKKAAGFGTGCVGSFGYIGASISGVLLGASRTIYGKWSPALILCVVFALIGAFTFFLTQRETSSPQK